MGNIFQRWLHTPTRGELRAAQMDALRRTLSDEVRPSRFVEGRELPPRTPTEQENLDAGLNHDGTSIGAGCNHAPVATQEVHSSAERRERDPSVTDAEVEAAIAALLAVFKKHLAVFKNLPSTPDNLDMAKRAVTQAMRAALEAAAKERE